MLGYCLMCECNRTMIPETRREEYEMHGEKVAIDVPRLICQVCGEANIDEDFGDLMIRLREEYHRRCEIY